MITAHPRHAGQNILKSRTGFVKEKLWLLVSSEEMGQKVPPKPAGQHLCIKLDNAYESGSQAFMTQTHKCL
jgi:hypothetical protein